MRFLESSPQFTVPICIFVSIFNGFPGQVFGGRFSGPGFRGQFFWERVRVRPILDSVGQIGNLGSRDRGIHSVLKCNAPDESDFFCITFYGF